MFRMGDKRPVFVRVSMSWMDEPAAPCEITNATAVTTLFHGTGIYKVVDPTQNVVVTLKPSSSDFSISSVECRADAEGYAFTNREPEFPESGENVMVTLTPDHFSLSRFWSVLGTE